MRRDWHKRFQRHLAAFRLGQAVMARDEAEHTVPDFESYVSTRRDASGARLLLDLVVYAGGLTLQSVYGYRAEANDDPMLELGQECVNILSNEIASGGGIWPVDVFPFREWRQSVFACPRCPWQMKILMAPLSHLFV